jgi:hypothetical protein
MQRAAQDMTLVADLSCETKAKLELSAAKILALAPLCATTPLGLSECGAWRRLKQMASSFPSATSSIPSPYSATHAPSSPELVDHGKLWPRKSLVLPSSRYTNLT